MHIILASGSSWKLELLRGVGLDAIGIEHRADEDAFDVVADPHAGIRRIAVAKARSLDEVARARDDGDGVVVIGADQMLLFDGVAYGKAADEDEARRRLMRLSGAPHTLVGGWAVVTHRGGEARLAASGIVESRLTMRALDADAIDRYVATGEWRGSCACYRYESIGRQLFSSVDGDYFSILGMPVEAILPALRELGGVPGLV